MCAICEALQSSGWGCCTLNILSDFQLVIYAGPNTNSRKVTEYGGNTLGYGSRSVLGTGWPKDLVKVTEVAQMVNTQCTYSPEELHFMCPVLG